MQRRDFLGLSVGALALAVAPKAAAAPSFDRFRVSEWGRARRFAPTAFGSIAYIDEGQGPEILFLHGFPLNGFQWRHAVEQLSLFNRCIVPDFLGLGFTEVADGQDVGPVAQVSMLIALLDTLKVARVHVIANDSGGAVAQLLVARHPDRVRTLMLTNCDTEIESPPAAMAPVIALSKQGEYVNQWLAPWLENKARARAPDGLGGMCFADPANPTDEAIDIYLGPLLMSARRRQLAEAYAIALEKNALAGIGPALRRSPVPVRIVWGMADTIFSPRGADHLDESFGVSLGIRRLPTSKLFWPEERPDVVVAEARALWESPAGRQRSA
jgi:pimeloyl-ACP methyl ester carboxylesterase